MNKPSSHAQPWGQWPQWAESLQFRGISSTSAPILSRAAQRYALALLCCTPAPRCCISCVSQNVRQSTRSINAELHTCADCLPCANSIHGSGVSLGREVWQPMNQGPFSANMIGRSERDRPASHIGLYRIDKWRLCTTEHDSKMLKDKNYQLMRVPPPTVAPAITFIPTCTGFIECSDSRARSS